MEFPIAVTAIKWKEGEIHKHSLMLGDGKCGDFVSVRPCAEEFEGKTFLGVLLGEIALGVFTQFDKETGELTVTRGSYNPAIYIPDRNAVVFGVGSYWGKIETVEQLRQITDDIINNQWYVRALKQLLEIETTTDAIPDGVPL